MAVLGCTVCNCVYNEDKRCCKGDIMVGGRKASSEEETCCDSFVDRKNDSASNSTQKPHDRISIDCEAENCKYNHNLRCVAEHVDIKGNGAKSSSGTLCATFTEASKSN